MPLLFANRNPKLGDAKKTTQTHTRAPIQILYISFLMKLALVTVITKHIKDEDEHTCFICSISASIGESNAEKSHDFITFIR